MRAVCSLSEQVIWDDVIPEVRHCCSSVVLLSGCRDGLRDKTSGLSLEKGVCTEHLCTFARVMCCLIRLIVRVNLLGCFDLFNLPHSVHVCVCVCVCVCDLLV